MTGSGVQPFSPADLDAITHGVADAWRRGAGRDWSVPAGTVEWSCAQTANHTIDAVLAVGFFLASRKQDGYPEWDWSTPTMADDAPAEQFAEAIATVGVVVSAVITAAPPDATAVIWRRPRPEVRPAADFAPRAALEMVLHAHDVCTGLGVAFEPPSDACKRLREHTRGWPHWSTPGWTDAPTTDDPWGDLLAGSGRARG